MLTSGVSHWGENFRTCKGKHQSPINIDIVKKVKLSPLKLTNFDLNFETLTLNNNGNTGNGQILMKIACNQN